jgi:altronate dehydratase
MATPTAHFVEALTGLGATGVQLIVAHVAESAMQGHPMIPTLQVATSGSGGNAFAADLDMVMDGDAADTAPVRDQLSGLIRGTLTRAYLPSAWSRGHTDFQLTRGLLGVSL